VCVVACKRAGGCKSNRENVEGTKAGAQGCGDEKKKKRMSTQMMLLSRVEHARSLMASRSGSLCDVLFLFFGGFPVSSLRLLCFFFFFRLVFSFAAKEAVDSPDMQNAQKKKKEEREKHKGTSEAKNKKRCIRQANKCKREQKGRERGRRTVPRA
jgi:uncharacterized membrane protein (DUF106 family)